VTYAGQELVFEPVAALDLTIAQFQFPEGAALNLLDALLGVLALGDVADNRSDSKATGRQNRP